MGAAGGFGRYVVCSSITQKTSMRVAAFYDEQWGSKQQQQDADTILLMMNSAVRHSYFYLGDVKGKKLLEVGCGSGQQAVYFASLGAIVTGIDVSSKSIATQSPVGNLSVLRMDAESMRFPDESFDLIYINALLMHVDKEKVISECRRVLRKGGKIIVVEPLLHNPFMRIYRHFSDYKKTNPSYMTLRKFKELSEGFSSFEHREFYFSSLVSLPLFRMLSDKQKAIAVSRIFESVDAGLLKVMPFLRGIYWVSVVKLEK